jgi:hypothetical protein
MKMNWGYKIVFAYVFFVIFIAVIATKAMRSNIDLVEKDYYQKEMVFQDQIGRVNNAKAIDAQLKFDYYSGSKTAELEFPKNHFKSGTVVLYRPSDAKKDQKIDLKSNGSVTSFTIPLSKLSTGLWKAKILWTDGKKEFYKEMDVVI